MLPWIGFFPLVVGDLSDLQFIQDRVDAGEWLEAHGAINAITNTISIIPASGKTLYMYRGKIIPTGHSNPVIMPTVTTNVNNITQNRTEAAFKVDGSIKDTANVGLVFATTISVSGSGSSGGGDQKESRFDVAGLSLVGDGVKAVTIENTLDNGSADATMSGWINTT